MSDEGPFEWFGGLGPLGRYAAALLFLGAAGIAYLCGYFVPWLWAVGAVLLIAAMLISDRVVPPPRNRDRQRHHGPPSRVAQVLGGSIKPFLILVVVGGLAWGSWAVVSHFRNYDSDAKAKAVLLNLEQYMTVDEVVDECGEPLTAVVFERKVDLVRGRSSRPGVAVVTAFPIPYTPDFLETRGGQLEEGFVFVYRFGYTGADEYELHFDGDGQLLDVKPRGPLKDWLKEALQSWQGEETEMISLVVLLTEPHSFDDKYLAGAASNALGVQISAGGDALDNVVIGEEASFLLFVGRFGTGYGYNVLSFDLPYVDISNVRPVAEVRSRAAVRKHKAWMSVDLVQRPDGFSSEQAYSTIGRVLAELINDDTCLAILQPATSAIIPYEPEMKAVLRSDAPLSVFATTE